MSLDSHSKPACIQCDLWASHVLVLCKVSFVLAEDASRFLSICVDIKTKLKKMATGKLVHLILFTCPLKKEGLYLSEHFCGAVTEMINTLFWQYIFSKCIHWLNLIGRYILRNVSLLRSNTICEIQTDYPLLGALWFLSIIIRSLIKSLY